jgi:hypothetical protein
MGLFEKVGKEWIEVEEFPFFLSFADMGVKLDEFVRSHKVDKLVFEINRKTRARVVHIPNEYSEIDQGPRSIRIRMVDEECVCDCHKMPEGLSVIDRLRMRNSMSAPTIPCLKCGHLP